MARNPRPRTARRRKDTSSTRRADDTLAVYDQDENLVHRTPPAVASSLRYLLARLDADPAIALPRRLGITSTLTGEGVTFVSRSLASIIAHDTGRRVCLVDLNWWGRPPRDESAETVLGASDVIDWGKSFDEVLQTTSIPQLSVLPAGDVPVSHRPVLARDPKVEAVLTELDAQFDHLIVDLPAVQATSDAISLTRLVDAVAIVVRHGVTTRAQVDATVRELRGTPSVGLVLNQVDSAIPRFVRRFVSP